MKEEFLISIIVPIYQVENYIEKCIESIVNQTYKNLEIILVDDGSNDKSSAICDKWANLDRRIIVVHKTNGGLSSARNAGLEIASGEYIGFVDGDDYIDKDMYQMLLSQIIKNGADISICDFRDINENDIEINSKNCIIREGVFLRGELLKEWCKDGFGYYVVAWNKLYSRNCFNNIRFPIGKIHEDNFIMYKIFFESKKIVCSKEKKYNYIHHPNSIMTRKITSKRLDDIEALCSCYDFYRSNGMVEWTNPIVTRLGNHYFEIRKYLNIFICNREDRKRIIEIDHRFRKIYFSLKSNKTIVNYLKYYLPSLYFEIQKINNKLHILSCMMTFAFRVHRNQAILIDTPTHGNLGDHAIVMAEQQLLSEYGIKSYELTANRINYHEKLYAKLTPMNQYILVPGGGFLGALWPEEEERFRRILQAFQKQKIIVFPQTVTFDISTEVGKKYLKQSQEIYSAHPDLTIFVREKKSYAFMKEYFPKVKCFLVPDIVTIMNSGIIKAEKRSGVLFCMRADTEKSIAQEELKSIEISVKNAIPEENIEYTDTVLDHMILPENRQREVTKKLKEFSEAKLIVTDRLHGMIFAALTNTPCIALSNSNGKVQAVYEWIKENEYIIFADDIEQIPNILQNLDLNKNYTYDRKQVQSSFSDLISMLEKINSNEK